MVKPIVEKAASEKKSDSCKYRGVRKRKWGKYVSEIRLPNSRQRIWLGSYDTAEKAARAFDAAMFCLRGSGARFNFPGDPPLIAGGRSMTPSQIQVAAARFANSEPPNECSGQPVTAPLESASSPSLSESEVTVPTDSDTVINGLLPDLFETFGSGNYEPGYGIYPGFDDFSGDFYVPDMPSFDYGEENIDGLIIQDSFLWNF